MGNRIFEESGIAFAFSEKNVYKADTEDQQYNGLSSVDFIVDMSEQIYFIEVKNLENPLIPPEILLQQKKAFLTKMNMNEGVSGYGDNRFQHSISLKLKDTLLKKLAMGGNFSKPVVYILLLEFIDLNFQQRRVLFENINSCLPKFSEEKFLSIHSVSFDLCDMRKYKMQYEPIFTGITQVMDN